MMIQGVALRRSVIMTVWGLAVVGSVVGLFGSHVLGADSPDSLAVDSVAIPGAVDPSQERVRPLPRPTIYHKNQPFRSILAAIDAGRWRHARQQAEKLNDPLFSDYITWLDYQRPAAGHRLADIEHFIRTHPDWPKQSILRLRAEEAMNDAPPRQILDWFADYPPLSATGRIHHAEALLATGSIAQAQEAIRKTWREADFGRRQEHQFIRRHHDLWTREDNNARLDRLLWEGKLTAARRVMGRVDSDHAALAEARRRLRIYRGGVDWAINQVPPQFRDHPGLLYERLRWRRRKQRTAEAIEILDQTPAHPPYPELWWAERDIIIRRVLDSEKYDLAYRLAREHRQSPGTLGFAEAEWLAGWIALRFLKDGAAAYKHFATMYENVRFSLSQSRAAYWAARAAADLGQAEQAAEWNRQAAAHPTTFYGQLASWALQETPRFNPFPEPGTDARAARDDQESARLITLLSAIGERQRIDPFIRHLYKNAQSPMDKALVIELAAAAGRSDLAAKYARDAQKLQIDLMDYAYPLPAQAGVFLPQTPGYDPALIMAIIRQESGFDPEAQSHAGARGMMQIMPATAKKLSRRLGLPYSRDRLKQDREYNLTLGRSYIKGLLERYDQSLILALAAYNAGPARVKRWIKKNGDPRTQAVNSLDWIEKIPFRETRIYVQRVLSNLQVYRARLASGGPLALDLDLHLPLHTEIH